MIFLRTSPNFDMEVPPIFSNGQHSSCFLESAKICFINTISKNSNMKNVTISKELFLSLVSVAIFVGDK